MGHGNRTPSAALVAVLSASLLAPGAACHLDSLLSPPRGVHPTGPDSLVQLRRDSSTLIPTGGSVPEPSIVMRAALRDTGLTGPVRLELEIQPVGTDFQGQATAASDPTSSGAHAYVSVGGLKNNTGYHWQARVVDQTGARAWQPYGENPEDAADVRVAVPDTVPAARLVFSGQPTTVTAGTTMPPVKVAVVDGQGNTLTSYTGSISVSLVNAGGATLGGNPNDVPVSAGVATFSDLSITRAGGGYRLSATSDGLAAVTSNSFAINPDAPDHLVFTVQPSNTQPNRPITPPVQVAVHDHYSNVVTSFTGIVYMGFAHDGSPLQNATLEPGGTQRAAAAGVATFEDLKIDQLGIRYTLDASTNVTKDGTSGPFDVTP